MFTKGIEDHVSGASRQFLELLNSKDVGSLSKIVKPWRGESLEGYLAAEEFSALPLITVDYKILGEENYLIDEDKITVVLGIMVNLESGLKKRYLGIKAHYRDLDCRSLLDTDRLLSEVSEDRPVYIVQANSEIDFVYPL